MKYIKEYSSWQDEEQKCNQLANSLINATSDFIRAIYPEIKTALSKRQWAYTEELILLIKHFDCLGIERLSRHYGDFEFISLEKNLFNITIRFKDWLNEEVDDLMLTSFLKNIFQKYQTNKHDYIFVIDNKDVQKVIDDIKIEDYEIFSDAGKYNL